MSKENTKMIQEETQNQEAQDQQLNQPDHQPANDQPETGEKPNGAKPAIVKPKRDWKKILRKVGRIVRRAAVGSFTVYGVMSFVKALIGGSAPRTMQPFEEETEPETVIADVDDAEE